jgi:excisionase family DNA binding protein
MSKKVPFYRDEEPTVPPLALRPREAALALSISVSTLDRLTKSGAIIACRVGGCRLFRTATLDAFLKGRETAGEGGQA